MFQNIIFITKIQTAIKYSKEHKNNKPLFQQLL